MAALLALSAQLAKKYDDILCTAQAERVSSFDEVADQGADENADADVASGTCLHLLPLEPPSPRIDQTAAFHPITINTCVVIAEASRFPSHQVQAPQFAHSGAQSCGDGEFPIYKFPRHRTCLLFEARMSLHNVWFVDMRQDFFGVIRAFS